MVAYQTVGPSKLVRIQCLEQAGEEARNRMKSVVGNLYQHMLHEEKTGFIDKESE